MRKPRTKLGRIRQWLKTKWHRKPHKAIYYQRVVIVRSRSR